MGVAAHLFMFLFAAPAGTLTYLVHIAADHQRVDTRILLAIITLLAIPLVGRPDMAGATMLYYATGIVLTATAIHGFTFSITAANYGLINTLRALANIYDTDHGRLVRPVIVAAASAVIIKYLIAPAAIGRHLLDIGATAIAISTAALLHGVETAGAVLAAIDIFLIQRVESATGLPIEFLVGIALTGVAIGTAHVLIPWWSIDRTIIQPILGAIGIILGTIVVMMTAVDTVTTSAQMAVITILFTTGLGIGVQLTNFVIRPNFQAVVPDRAHSRSDEQSQSGTDRDVDQQYR